MPTPQERANDAAAEATKLARSLHEGPGAASRRGTAAANASRARHAAEVASRPGNDNAEQAAHVAEECLAYVRSLVEGAKLSTHEDEVARCLDP